MPSTRSRSRKKKKEKKNNGTEENKFSVELFEAKGRGVVAQTTISKGEQLFPYLGEVISKQEGDRREKRKSTGFRFFYKTQGKSLCVDATEENETLGRLVNHGPPNAKITVIDTVLWFTSLRQITPGEEILYDYGIRPLPWTKKSKGGADILKTCPETCQIKLVASRLADEDWVPLQEFSDQHGNVQLSCLKIKDNSEVTHVIIKTDPPGSKISSRTFKLFWGIANKCWVLDYKWILDSNDAGKILPEAEYEIVGDETSGECHNGPCRSRTSSELLLSGYQFIFNGFSNTGKLTLDYTSRF